MRRPAVWVALGLLAGGCATAAPDGAGTAATPSSRPGAAPPAAAAAPRPPATATEPAPAAPGIELAGPAAGPRAADRPATPAPARARPAAAQAAARAETRARMTRRVELEPSRLDDGFAFIKRWFTTGNVPVKVGVVLSVFGVGFLVKEGVDRQWLVLPLELRLMFVALFGIALLVLGWRLRHSERTYALSVQGGGVAVLYLTIYASFWLFHLLPSAAAFALLLVVTAAAGTLAVLQDSRALAVLGIVGGFMAPVLVSSGSGNHVALLSYYAILNVAIVGIAWFKAWRVLNLLGFAFTFIVGTAWGVTRYRPENFATTEPFLIAFFLFYVAIAVLYALRRSVELRDYVDAGLVFGTPLVAAGLQAALVRDIEYAMSVSALAMSALYLVLARFLYTRRRDDLRLLVESFLALGVVFATLAIPLAVDPHWTAAAWAVEGAAIVWAGVRQQRLAVRAFGYLLEFGAGTAFFFGPAPWLPVPPGVYPIVNSGFVGCVLVALAGLFSAWFVDRNRDRVHGAERAIAIAFFVWGTVWWLFAGGHEIDRFVAANYALASVLVFLAASAIAFAVLEKRLSWPMARVPAMLLLPALLVIAIGASVDTWTTSEALFAYGGFVAWPVAVGAAIALLWWYDDKEVFKNMHAPLSLELWHAGLFWLVLLIVTHEVAWAGTRIAQGRGVWSAVPWGLVPALAIVAIGALASRAGWPIGAHRRGYLVIGATPIAVILVVWSIAASILGAGDPWPLPYVPLLNPLDLTQAIVLLALASWAIRAGREEPALFAALPKHAMVALLCALAFLWINAIALRTIHFWYGVPMIRPRSGARRWCRPYCRFCGRRSRSRRWPSPIASSGGWRGSSGRCSSGRSSPSSSSWSLLRWAPSHVSSRSSASGCCCS